MQLADKATELVAAVRVPLGVLLGRGLELAVDGRPPRRFDFHHCRAEGCLALFAVTDRLRRELERGREAQIRFHLLDGRSVGVPMSLLGITAGIEALAAKQREGAGP